MKIRAGFVSNSSSTSFLLMAESDLERGSFFELMGIEENSPLSSVFTTLYHTVLENSENAVNLGSIPVGTAIQDWFKDFSESLTPRMIEKLEEGRRLGWKAYYGRLTSESTNAECFFCTDSFEVANDRIYFNALECVW